MVNSVGPTASVADLGAAVGLPQQKSLGQQDFLKLMVAQIKNQDPMQPQPNGEFLAQLAQFSTNDGITKMQTSLAELATSLQSNQALQASSLVGRKVLVDGSVFNLDSTGGAKLSVDAVPGLQSLTASIYSPAGDLIKTLPLGQVPTGLSQFSWDGTDQNNQPVAAGQYKVQVTANYLGEQVPVPTLVTANVDSVTLGQNGDSLKLNVAGVGPVLLSDVRQITV